MVIYKKKNFNVQIIARNVNFDEMCLFLNQKLQSTIFF